jgi:hypothetical protein
MAFKPHLKILPTMSIFFWANEMQKKPVVNRIMVSLAAGCLIGFAISEVTFFFLRETARPPKSIEIVIPAGTAELVARGEQPPNLPDDMTFVVGDTLIVKNADVVDHQLGPLWIPAGASARLELGEAENLAVECSFQPDRSVGLDIREALTLSTRLYGVLYTGIPLGILIALYTSVAPQKKKDTL